MIYRVVITARAQRDIDAFARYCRSYSPAFWNEQSDRLVQVFETWLSNRPGAWSYFFVTGAPYRAYLFDVGERTKYWLVYTIDDRSRTVHLLRMWNAARNPQDFRA
jgi:mRNA-degrading endonuclease RelE of RelBE toxin-antitoxin system